MQKKAVLLIVATIAFASATTVYAEQGSDDSQSSGQTEVHSNRGPNNIADMHTLNNAQISGTPAQTREEIRQQIKLQRTDLKQEIKTNREEIKEMTSDFRIEQKQKIASLKEQMKASESAEKENFRERIASFSAEKKKLTAEQIDTKLSTINQNRTDKMTQALVRLQEILNKLIDRTNAAKAAGADTSSVETAINTAKTAIATAESAVTAQAAKTYTANITSEQTAGSAFSTVFTQLQSDLKTTVTSVEAARKAVLQVAVALGKVEVTVSVTPNVTEAATPTP